jgi:hypothetical protein
MMKPRGLSVAAASPTPGYARHAVLVTHVIIVPLATPLTADFLDSIAALANARWVKRCAMALASTFCQTETTAVHAVIRAIGFSLSV